MVLDTRSTDNEDLSVDTTSFDTENRRSLEHEEPGVTKIIIATLCNLGNIIRLEYLNSIISKEEYRNFPG